MCGIAGIFETRADRTPNRELMTVMTRSLEHRGPDGEGIHVEPGLALGHRRLSIIDLAGGYQPMRSYDGRAIVSFNGEIYNFREIRVELEKCGHRFTTNSDTEVILNAWIEWGEECLARFNGMFAFAVWDTQRKQLFIARDRIGIKPLYYSLLPDGQLIFASELKALFLHPDCPRKVDPQATEDFFAFGYVPDPKTIVSGIHKLPPGHFLLAEPGAKEVRVRQYWEIAFEPGEQAGEAAVAEELHQRLSDAVNRRLVADVPLGAFLSGGVDSSAVVSCMAALKSDPVTTCSISFGDPAYNEAVFAQQVAELYHTSHNTREVNPGDSSLIDLMCEVYDEPFADSSALPTYRVCELARSLVTVALSGDGGDENFGGYRRYRWHMNEERVRRMIPLGIRSVLFGAAGAIYPKIDWAPKFLRAKTTLQSIGRSSLDGYLHSVCVVDSAMRKRLFSRALGNGLQGYQASEVFREHLARAPSDDPLAFIQYLDFKTYLPGDILTKVDRASMQHGLEVRVPILDHEFVSWASGLSSDIKLRGREGKYILKKAFEPYLPDEVLYRDKMGFAVPISSWFRNELRDQVEQEIVHGRLADCGWFEQKALADVVKQHQSGMREHGAVLWSLLMFERFLAGKGLEIPA